MNEHADWFLIFVVTIAFFAGYSVVSFFVKKMKSQESGNGQGRTSSESSAKSEGVADKKVNSERRDRRTQQGNQHWRWKQDEEKRRSETWDSQNEEQKHARVLRLVGRVTASEVKRAYRELVAKYHPDKVNHLGDEFKQIAEERTREIVAAYEYFCRKYDIG